MELLRGLEPTPEYLDLRINIMLEEYETKNKTIAESKDKVQNEITKLEEMLQTLKEKHLAGVYSDKDFMVFRDDLETRIMAKKTLLTDKAIEIDELKLMTNWIRAFFTNLDKIFVMASPEVRQELGCSIFPEGLFFSEGNFQTPKIARCYALKEGNADLVSASVRCSGFEPLTNRLRGDCSTAELTPRFSGASGGNRTPIASSEDWCSIR